MSNILENVVISPNEVQKSRAWFNEQIQIMSRLRLTPNQVLTNKAFKMTGNILPGRLYFYFYDAKLKDKLPYWDQFPLVFPLSKGKDSFTGLNLHYLEYQPRMSLLQELLKVNGNNSYTETRKISVSWGLVSGMAKLAPAQACIKMYLNEHLASPFCEVSPEYWHTAMMLPVQRFVGASKESVWRDSRLKYRTR